MISSEAPARLKWQMFALSFTALFMEMMVIRWVPSVVHLVAYYANLMLLSSFLGLGVGALVADRKWRLFEWLPLLFTLEIITLWFARDATVGAPGTEARFYAAHLRLFNLGLLIWIFAVNALLFVPLGQRMGVLFNTLPRLSAYGWDLAGSLGGTLAFALFSLKLFSPLIGFAAIMILLLTMSQQRWFASAVYITVLGVMFVGRERAALWSPYYYITVNRIESPGIAEFEPPAALHTMRDPPIYGVHVNQFGYHFDAAFDPSRYSADSPHAELVARMRDQYRLPYALGAGRNRVLIVGSGGGADVEAALAEGVQHVDAVEIDSVIVSVSQRFNAARPYTDRRVAVHIDDARAYMKRARGGYDLVVFGFLDSQALFSSMSNVRLDGHVYTVESLRTAYGLLNERGVLSLSFYLGIDWLGPKLFQMLAAATGRQPVMYLFQQQMILVVPKDSDARLPMVVGNFQRTSPTLSHGIDLATDDWPYLYLKRKTIPIDYGIGIASLVALSICAIALLHRGTFGGNELHFFFLGMGFLLLETKSIGDCTLFFGATWVVTLIVVTGVLAMVMAANLVARRLRGFSFALYIPLFAALAVLLAVPREHILGWDFSGRLSWALVILPLPVFFAGLIFSTAFREAKVPSTAFAANLIGAMLGGFCEYIGMLWGSHRLALLLVALYLGSLLSPWFAARLGRRAEIPVPS